MRNRGCGISLLQAIINTKLGLAFAVGLMHLPDVKKNRLQSLEYI